MLGTGFSGSLKNEFRELITKVNKSQHPVFSIDTPSGLDSNDGYDESIESYVIKASYTFYLGMPKTGHFLRDSWNWVGSLVHCDFGLEKAYYEQANSTLELLEEKAVKSYLPRPSRSQNKYSIGPVTLLCGSVGMVGAAFLAAKACLRSGAGLVRLLHNREMSLETQNSFPELVKLCYDQERNLQEQYQFISEQLLSAKSCVIGSGLGQSEAIKKLLSKIIPHVNVPSVLDADALNIYAEFKFSLPKGTILTPHLERA